LGLAFAMTGLFAAQDLAAQDVAMRQARTRRPHAQRSAPDDGRVWVGDLPIRVDRATRTLRRPTREEARQLVSWLRAALDRSGRGLPSAVKEDGTRQVTVQGRFGGVVVARALPDGTMETRCVGTFDEATAFLGLRPESAPAAALQ
jgi:hypothetical protein